MPNVMAHPAVGEELDLQDPFVARFEEEDEEDWDADSEEGWADDDLDDDDEWDEDDDWDDEDDDEWEEEEGWDDDEEEEA